MEKVLVIKNRELETQWTKLVNKTLYQGQLVNKIELET